VLRAIKNIIELYLSRTPIKLFEKTHIVFEMYRMKIIEKILSFHPLTYETSE